MKKWRIQVTCAAIAAISTAPSAHSASLVYEGFDYTLGSDVPGQGGTVDGWSGNWTNSGGSNQPDTTTGLTFPSLASTGGAAQRPTRSGNGAMSRTFSAASQTALTADNSTIWFSVLMRTFEGSTGDGSTDGFALNSYGTIVLGDAALSGGSGNSAAPIAGTGNALGVGFAGTGGGPDFGNVRIQGVTYSGGTATASTPTTVGSSTLMIVGSIDWAANGNNDVLNLYNVADPTAALPAAFATMNVDLDQSTFNVVSIGDAQTSVFDEIRFGLSYSDVSPVPEPTTLGLLALSGLGFMRRRRK